MNKVLVAIVAVLLVAGGYYWYLQEKKGPSTDSMKGDMAMQSDMGTYPYVCDNGSEFTMTPASDVSTIHLMPGSGAAFSATTLTLVRSSAGARYEGGGIAFVGAGEGVQLTVGSTTFACNPKPNPELAPWNWGDAGEGGGVKQDASLIVAESIQGKWQSTDDAKFVREFLANDKVTDYYEGKVVTSGLWVAFTKANAPKVFPYPMEDGSVYIQMTEKGTQQDTLNFKVTKLTSDELQLIYLDRGGALNFKAVK